MLGKVIRNSCMVIKSLLGVMNIIRVHSRIVRKSSEKADLFVLGNGISTLGFLKKMWKISNIRMFCVSITF